MRRHFGAIADAPATCRSILYNIPQRVIVNVDPGSIVQIAASQHANVVAVKQATPDHRQARAIVEAGLAVYAGNDDLVLPFLELGGCGGIWLPSHLVATRFIELCDLVAADKIDEAHARNNELAPLLDALHITVNPFRSRPRSHCSATRRRSEPAADRGDRRRARRHPGRTLRIRPHGPCGRDGHTMTSAVRIIPLGGLGEVGKNMTVVEQDGERILIDAGLSFPRDEMLGVDLVLPDFGYLRDAPGTLRAVILTHGHEDHVGALPYLMREVGVPEVWGTRLTLGLIKSKLDEHGVGDHAKLIEVDPRGEPVQIGPFKAEFVRVTHSIPDAVAVALHTDQGTLLHTGDLKLDHTPIDGQRTDLAKFARLGEDGLALVAGRLDERRARGCDRERAGRRRRAAPHRARCAGPGDRDLVRLAHPPAAGGDRCLRGVRAPGLRDRPLDGAEPQRRPQPRLRRRRRGHAGQARAASPTSRRARSRSCAPARRASRSPRSRAWRSATTPSSRSSRAIS